MILLRVQLRLERTAEQVFLYRQANSNPPPSPCFRTTSSQLTERAAHDMWMAACCLAYEAPLATLNLKDYEDFTGYHGLPILGAQ